ncbi:MAG: hypothetical protein ABJC13_03945 [Acidobacteriota bacterium]
MRRTTYPFLLLYVFFCPAFGAASAESQEAFSKRVLVYLDLSGSMHPDKDDSPFVKTVEALQLLLREPEFLTANDEVRFFLFADRILDEDPLPGGSLDRPLIETLRERILAIQNDPLRNPALQRTDFQAVAESLRAQLSSRDRKFMREVAIIASDFVHEPSRIGRKKSTNDPAYWQRAMTDWQQVLDITLKPWLEDRTASGNDTRNPLLLGVAPLTATDEAENRLRTQVLDDLEKVRGLERREIGSGGINARDLAQEIKRRLYFPLSVVALPSVRQRTIHLEIQNPNAAEVRLSRIELACIDANGIAIGDPKDLPLIGSKFANALAMQRSTADELLFPSDACPATTASYRIHAISREGVDGTADKVVGWVEASVERSVFERNFLRHDGLLRVFASMRGDSTKDETYQVTLQRIGSESDEGKVKRCFNVPEDLDIKDFKNYAIAIAVPMRFESELSENQFEVHVEKSEASLTKPEEDVGSSHTNSIQGVVGVVVTLISIVIGLTKRKFFAAIEWNHLLTIFAGGLANIGSTASRLNLLSTESVFSWLSRPIGRSVLVALALSILTYFLVRWYYSGREMKIAQAPQPPTDKDIEQIERDRVKPRYWFGSVFLVAVFLAWSLSPPAVDGATPIQTFTCSESSH